MPHVWILLSLLNLPISAAGNVPKLQVPESVFQGGTLRILATGLSGGSNLTARFLEKDYPFYPAKSTDTCRVLIGIELLAASGRFPLLIIHQRPWRWDQEYRYEVRIQSPKWTREAFNLAPEKQDLGRHPKAAEAKQKLTDAYAARTPEQLWEGTFQKPVPGKTTSRYGARRSINGKPDRHYGTDFDAEEEDPVFSPNKGSVLLSEEFPEQGGTVVIDHGQGVVSVLMHLSAAQVIPQTPVNKGDPIGKAGQTGRATGTNLHWGLRIQGVPVDPLPWLEQEY